MTKYTVKRIGEHPVKRFPSLTCDKCGTTMERAEGTSSYDFMESYGDCGFYHKDPESVWFHDETQTTCPDCYADEVAKVIIAWMERNERRASL